ncbi:ABC transporter permease [Halalkalibacter hemicellulosilyticus]|uniref:Putative sugar ABC transporter permease protein n=1 Tax=Halalkalibacter hemicellulosilyticusJCM 9152 TaxID=1236971 RepID=W4QLM9_9BACI|nr:ABC transporter permease [Halalkalibacter hemicellulosilyticus]GAE32259.1 putative sugar ABC transporter permease protein [Halalkalibacter hemicellulosilyticusJCM 9152]
MELFDLSLLNSTLRMVTPILLAALGGMLCARVGIFNVGLEGLILVGAFSAIVANYFTGNLWFSIFFAALMSMLFSLILAVMTIQFKANMIVVGIAINFLALGLTTFLLRTIFEVKGAFYDNTMSGLSNIHIPFVQDIPVLGTIFSGHTVLVYVALIVPFILFIFMYRTVTGFRMISVGYNQVAAHSLGIRVKGLQYLAVAMSGVLCGLAGAQLSLGLVTMFSEGMTAGRGFIALVATMLGQSHPFGVLGASLLFGLTDALSTRMQSFSIPTQFTSMIPYILTLVAMFLLKGRGVEMNHSNQQSSR